MCLLYQFDCQRDEAELYENCTDGTGIFDAIDSSQMFGPHVVLTARNITVVTSEPASLHRRSSSRCRLSLGCFYDRAMIAHTSVVQRIYQPLGPKMLAAPIIDLLQVQEVMKFRTVTWSSYFLIIFWLCYPQISVGFNTEILEWSCFFSTWSLTAMTKYTPDATIVAPMRPLCTNLLALVTIVAIVVFVTIS